MAKFCGKCGAPIKEGTKFCTRCGYKFANKSTQPEINPPEPIQQPVQAQLTEQLPLSQDVPTQKMPVIQEIPVQPIQDDSTQRIKLIQDSPAQPIQDDTTQRMQSIQDFSEQQSQDNTPMPQFKVAPIPEPPTYESVAPKKKHKTGKTVLIIILIIAILAGIGTAGFIAYDKFWKNKSTEEDFKKALQKCSDRNMIAFYYDDYDSDGNNEAYAIMGNDGDTEKNYSNADIWFVNSDTTTQVDENVSGHTNGKISQGKTKFVSFERNTNDDNSVSDLYGVKENKSYEPEISGQYKNVHQDGEEIIAQIIETGKEIELKIDDKGNIEEIPSEDDVDNDNIIVNDADIENLMSILNNFWIYGNLEYSCDEASAYEKLLNFLMTGVGVNPLYEYYFPDGEEPVSVSTGSKAFKDSPDAEKDPLNKFSDWNCYMKVSADNIDWIINKIFGVPVSRSENEVGQSCVYYYEDYYYFKYGGGGDVPSIPVITNYKLNSDDSYTVDVDYVGYCSIPKDYSSNKIQCKMQMIDGKDRWVFTSVTNEVSDSELTSKDAVQVNISSAPTADELTKALSGGWSPISQNSTADMFVFDAQGNFKDIGASIFLGSFKVNDDLSLTVKTQDDEKTFKWTPNALTDQTGWYIDANSYLIINGSNYGKYYDENSKFYVTS